MPHAAWLAESPAYPRGTRRQQPRRVKRTPSAPTTRALASETQASQTCAQAQRGPNHAVGMPRACM